MHVLGMEAKHGMEWDLLNDPFLLHDRLLKIVPISYTNWDDKSKFQIYPYTAFFTASHHIQEIKVQ